MSTNVHPERETRRQEQKRANQRTALLVGVGSGVFLALLTGLLLESWPFAIGLGAATQVFTLGFGEGIFGESELSVALLNGAGWAINLAVAEWIIRRTPRRVVRPAADQTGVRA